jgi:hypothetical protein
MSCDALPDAFFSARLAGAIDADVHWRGADMQCDGMRRPDGQGLRVTFSGAIDGERLTLVFAAPRLAEGAGGRAVPVNVTLIREGGHVYSTRGEGKCSLDEVVQAPLARPAATGSSGVLRHWRIEARGFCLEPVRAVAAGAVAADAIILTTFDFRGQLTWEPDPPEAPAGADQTQAAPAAGAAERAPP